MESISFVHWYECNELTHCDLNKKVILIIVIIANVKMTTFDNYFIIDYIQLHSCKLIMVITPAHTTPFNCLFMRILSSIQIPWITSDGVDIYLCSDDVFNLVNYLVGEQMVLCVYVCIIDAKWIFEE